MLEAQRFVKVGSLKLVSQDAAQNRQEIQWDVLRCIEKIFWKKILKLPKNNLI